MEFLDGEASLGKGSCSTYRPVARIVGRGGDQAELRMIFRCFLKQAEAARGLQQCIVVEKDDIVSCGRFYAEIYVPGEDERFPPGSKGQRLQLLRRIWLGLHPVIDDDDHAGLACVPDGLDTLLQIRAVTARNNYAEIFHQLSAQYRNARVD